MSELRGYDAWKTDTRSEDDRLSQEAECVECNEDFPRDQLNERGYCHECECRYDGKSPNYDPGDMVPDEWWSGGFAENH